MSNKFSCNNVYVPVEKKQEIEDKVQYLKELNDFFIKWKLKFKPEKADDIVFYK